ncbi:MAG: DUF6056 family protein [Bacteroidales bacterium]|nr:DUF6056 family protein [Bacteroidales bacterium]
MASSLNKSKLFNYISENIYSIILVFFCLFVIFPFVFLTQYNVPGASDDLLHGWFKADKSYFDGIWSWYSGGYNGRFANAFFMQIPGRFFLNVWFGKVFPLFLVSTLLLSIFFLFQAYSKKSSVRNNLFFSTILISFYLAITPDIHQFYWFSGATVYVLPAIFYFFFLGMQIRAIETNLSVWQVILNILLLFFIIGSNENWMIIGFITSVLFFINPILLKKRPSKGQIWILVFTVIFVLLVVFAPGTTFRMTMEGAETENADLFASLGLAAFNIFGLLENWFLNWGSIIAMFGLLVIVSHDSKQNNVLSPFSNKFMFYLLFILIFAGIFIIMFSLGHFLPLRVRGVVPTFFTCTIILIFLIRRLGQNEKLKSKITFFSRKSGLFILSIGMLLIFSSSSNVKNAYIDIFSGNAKEAAEQSIWVQNYIKNSSEQELYIPQLNRKTLTLYTFYIPENPNGWYHWSTAIYFKKKIITTDYNYTLDEFIRIKSNPNGVLINSESNFCSISDFLISDITKKDLPKIRVKANVYEISPESEAMLVFESDPLWKGFFINEIKDDEGNIDFTWDFPLDSTFNTDILKVYLFNSNNDIVLVKPISGAIIQ